MKKPIIPVANPNSSKGLIKLKRIKSKRALNFWRANYNDDRYILDPSWDDINNIQRIL